LDETARLLCVAGSWLKYRDPEAADRYYKALVLRCRKTAIGAKADQMRWFPELDAEGNLRRSRFESMELPGTGEIGSSANIANYPTPGKRFILQEGDRVSDIVAAVERLGVSITAGDIYRANPELSRWDYVIGREILIPVPQEMPGPAEPSAEESPISIDGSPTSEEIPAHGPGIDYIIQRGDTIVKVAKQFSISEKNISIANPGVDFHRLKVGQKIWMPLGTDLN
jgi:LysM repeat protein